MIICMEPLLVLSQCSIAEMGTDLPFLIADIDARLTCSVRGYVQRRGRVSRVYPRVDGDRSYQKILMDKARESLLRKKNPLILSACGSGKGEMAAMIAAACHAKSRSVAIITCRRLLVSDLSMRIARYGTPNSIIMAGVAYAGHKTCVVSFDTATSRGLTLDVDLIIVDECDLAMSEQRLAFIDRNSHIPRIGMTATAVRGDGRGLKRLFDEIIEGPSIMDLQQLGFLVPPKVYCAPEVDVSSLDINGEDFNESQAEKVMNKPGLVGNLVKEYQRLAYGLPAIVHASSVAHSKSIVERFLAEGIAAAHIDADSSDAERDAVFARLTLSAKPKTHSILIDVASNVLRMGFPDDHREYTLEDQQKASKSPTSRAMTVVRCPKCWFTYRAGPLKCPECGKASVKSKKQIQEREAELVELKRVAAVKRTQTPAQQELLRVYQDIAATAKEKNYKPGWALVQFKYRTGQFPPKWIRDHEATNER